MPEYNQYFYHSDHASTGLSTGLGSASFITNATGYVDQHIQYLPFGELFISQRNSEFDSRYKFTAKELDNETNYTYFGARYYDSDLSIWLSIDPLSDKYPSLSPYMYCAGNPVILVDPDGMSFDEWGIDASGNIKHLKFKEGPDELYRIDSKGNKISSSDGSSGPILFNSSDIQKATISKVNILDSGAEKVGEKYYSSYEITNFETAEKLFEFFADFDNFEASFTSLTNYETNENLFLIRTT